MTPPERGRRKTKWVAVAAALSWAVLGLLCAQVLALPHPFLPPPSFAELLGRIPATTRPDRFIIMLFKETSLLLTAYEEKRGATAPGCAARDVQDTGVAAVVAFYSPTDLVRLSSMGYLGGMDGFVGGSLGTVPERYLHLSPVSHVDPGDPPTFLAHGGDDRTVPPGQSELLGVRLREAGVPHRLVELPWANHTFDFLWGGWGSQITRYSLKAFLDSNLKPRRSKRRSLVRSGISATNRDTKEAARKNAKLLRTPCMRTSENSPSETVRKGLEAPVA